MGLLHKWVHNGCHIPRNRKCLTLGCSELNHLPISKFPLPLCQSVQSRQQGLQNWWTSAAQHTRSHPNYQNVGSCEASTKLNTLLHLTCFLFLPAPPWCLQWPDPPLCLCSPLCCRPSSSFPKKCSKNWSWTTCIHPYRSRLRIKASKVHLNTHCEIHTNWGRVMRSWDNVQTHTCAHTHTHTHTHTVEQYIKLRKKTLL